MGIGPALALAGILFATTASIAGAQQGAASTDCSGLGPGTEVGAVADPAVVELSGIVASRAHVGVLWVHNDSGGAPEVIALSSTGEALGRYPVDGAAAVDWEDIGIGPGPEEGRTYLYLADIGDNGSTREHVTVYRAAEPDAAPDARGATLPLVDELTIRYPDGPSDAESLFVDPVDGDLYVITKDLSGMSRVLRAAAEVVEAGGDITMEDVGGFQAQPRASAAARAYRPRCDGADISPDGSTVLVRTYQGVLGFRRPAGRPVAEAFSAAACAAPSVSEAQGEAIAFSVDGASYVTVSEGSAPPVHRFTVDPPLAEITTTTTTRARPGRHHPAQ